MSRVSCPVSCETHANPLVVSYETLSPEHPRVNQSWFHMKLYETQFQEVTPPCKGGTMKPNPENDRTPRLRRSHVQ